MITLSNKHQFEYMVASGALGFDGRGWPWEWPVRWIGKLDPSLFTIATKSITLNPELGWLGVNPLIFPIRILDGGGVLNAVRLANFGFDWFCRFVAPWVDSEKIRLVPNIFGEPEELAEMAFRLNPFDFVAIEINASCPNTATDILVNTQKVIECVRAVSKVTRFPIILKLSVVHDVVAIINAVGNLIEAISINSVPWEIVFPGKISPLASLGGGGVSGKKAQPFTWGFVEKLANLTDIPIIGPGACERGDIEKILNRGARVPSFGSIHLLHCWRPTLYVRERQKILV